jgi:plastocyanin
MHKERASGLVVVLVLAAAIVWPASTAMAGAGCHGAGATQGEGDTVEMVKACFTPSVLQVEPGTEVTFLNSDPATHNISATGWGSDQDLEEGDSFTAIFDEEGTFPYACMYHFGMTGAIVVGDGTGPASGASVEVGSVRDLLPLSQERADTVTSEASETSDSSPIAGWTLAAGIGLLVGAGAMRFLRRGPRED